MILIMLNSIIRINTLFLIAHIIQLKHIQVKPKSKSVIHLFSFVSDVNRLINSPISRIVSVPTTITMNL